MEIWYYPLTVSLILLYSSLYSWNSKFGYNNFYNLLSRGWVFFVNEIENEIYEWVIK